MTTRPPSAHYTASASPQTGGAEIGKATRGPSCMSRFGPFFKFYPADWLAAAEISTMTLEQQGAYIRLLCYNWREGSLPNDVDKMARLVGTDPLHFRGEIWPALEGCFELRNEGLVNPRLEDERLAYQRISNAGRIGGKASAAARQTDTGQQHGTVVPESLNEKASKSDVRSQKSETTTAYSAEFEQVWELYPKRNNNSKRRAYKAWSARVREGVTPEELAAGVGRYAEFVKGTDERFIKQAATFFGPDEHWRESYTHEKPTLEPSKVCSYKCGLCGETFESSGSPAFCPDCGRCETQVLA